MTTQTRRRRWGKLQTHGSNFRNPGAVPQVPPRLGCRHSQTLALPERKQIGPELVRIERCVSPSSPADYPDRPRPAHQNKNKNNEKKTYLHKGTAALGVDWQAPKIPIPLSRGSNGRPVLQTISRSRKESNARCSGRRRAALSSRKRSTPWKIIGTGTTSPL